MATISAASSESPAPRSSSASKRARLTRPPFIQLDYLYTPSKDVAADARYFADVLGGWLIFTIEGMGARVAKIALTDGRSYVLLTDHLEGNRPVFIYRVEDLDRSMRELTRRGWRKTETLEIPTGPCCSFSTPGGHRLAIYELTRPDVAKHFDGRFDF